MSSKPLRWKACLPLNTVRKPLIEPATSPPKRKPVNASRPSSARALATPPVDKHRQEGMTMDRSIVTLHRKRVMSTTGFRHGPAPQPGGHLPAPPPYEVAKRKGVRGLVVSKTRNTRLRPVEDTRLRPVEDTRLRHDTGVGVARSRSDQNRDS